MSTATNPQNRFKTTNGIDWNGTQYVTKPLEIPLPPDTSSSAYGRSITPRAFRKMVGDKLIQLKKKFSTLPPGQQTQQSLEDFLMNEKCSVDFGKETVLRILSQENCTGIRLTFCVNDIGEESIIISGVEDEEVTVTDTQGLKSTEKRSFLINRRAYEEQSATNASDRGILDTFDDEKGVGNSYGTFLKDSGITLSDLMKEDLKSVQQFTNHVLGLM